MSTSVIHLTLERVRQIHEVAGRGHTQLADVPDCDPTIITQAEIAALAQLVIDQKQIIANLQYENDQLFAQQ